MTADTTTGRPRIALVATDLSTGGGVNRVIRDLAAMFSERLKCEVTVLNGRSGRAPTYPFPPMVERIDQPSASLWAYLKALLALRQQQPDVVIGSWTQDNILLGLIFVGSPTRLIVAEHTSFNFHPPLIRWLRRLVYHLADAVVVLNPTEFTHYRQHLNNVHLIPNAIVPAETIPSVERKRHIIVVGHLEPRKNFRDAIEALATSGIEQDGWSMTIIGDGPDAAKLKDAVASAKLERVEFQSPGVNLEQFYVNSSLTLVTATLEVFSLVLAEAMAAGVVPLAYATDGPSFILEDFHELLIDIGDVASLAQRLRELAEDKNLEPLRHRLASSIRRRFAPQIIEAQWQALLEQLGCGPQRDPAAAARQIRS